MHRNVTAVTLREGRVEPVVEATVRMRVARVPGASPVMLRRLDERVRALALDLADGDISRIVIEDDGTITVVNASRRG